MQGDAWYLLDMAGQKQYKIEDLFNSLNQITEINAQYETNQKKISSHHYFGDSACSGGSSGDTVDLQNQRYE